MKNSTDAIDRCGRGESGFSTPPRRFFHHRAAIPDQFRTSTYLSPVSTERFVDYLPTNARTTNRWNEKNFEGIPPRRVTCSTDLALQASQKSASLSFPAKSSPSLAKCPAGAMWELSIYILFFSCVFVVGQMSSANQVTDVTDHRSTNNRKELDQPKYPLPSPFHP